MGADEGEPAERLLIDGLTLAPDVPPIHDKVRAGEIVGLAGLEGHGQEPFLEALCGLRSPLSGRLMVEAHGRWVAIASFRQAVRCGVAYLARDRRANGIFPSLSLLDNFALVSMDRDRSFGLIDRRKQRARYETYQRRLSIVAPSPGRAITTLSGGNQQKVLLARWLALEPRVLLLNDPTGASTSAPARRSTRCSAISRATRAWLWWCCRPRSRSSCASASACWSSASSTS